MSVKYLCGGNKDVPNLCHQISQVTLSLVGGRSGDFRTTLSGNYQSSNLCGASVASSASHLLPTERGKHGTQGAARSPRDVTMTPGWDASTHNF
ncbi:hypothetical protein CDAR_191791 [Caerostris darwini]|uniref:Uncharacterized protein n=1 Tax=Caerostris darwini TaxID=1538125 RepID=A0AAV4P7V8_9ARAC|nr:hypothetical protein CDAR_191791 [Caerostris darwini]